MSDAIRIFLLGRQATVDVVPTTMINLPVEDFKDGHKAARHKVQVHNGTRVREQAQRRGKKNGELSFKMGLYYDLTGWVWCSLFNAPVTASHTLATGVKDHTYKQGSSVPLLCAQYYDGQDWWQMLNCSVDTGSFTLDNDKYGVGDYKLVGQFPTKISAPTVPAQSYAAYNHPAEGPHLAMTIAGVAYPTLISGKINVKNGRAPFHTARRNADMKRAQEGIVEVDFDLTVENAAGYTGDLLEKFDLNTPPGAFVIDYLDSDTPIGTGTPTTPLMRWTIPLPDLGSGDNDFAKIVGQYQIKGSAAYHGASAAALVALLTNEITSYAGS